MTHNYGIMRMKKITNLGSLQKISNHNFRTDWNMQSLQHVDSTKPIRTLLGSGNYASDYQEAVKRCTVNGKTPMVQKKSVYGWDIVLTATDFHNIDLPEWVEANRIWLYNTFGQENVASAVFHADEKTPHLHCFVTPFHYSEKLNRYVSGAKHWTGGTEKMRQLQDSYYEQVSSRFGLERGNDSRTTNAQHVEPHVYRETTQKQRKSFEEYFMGLTPQARFEWAFKASQRLQELEPTDKKYEYFKSNLETIQQQYPELITGLAKIFSTIPEATITEPNNFLKPNPNQLSIRIEDMVSSSFSIGAMFGAMFALGSTQQQSQIGGMSLIDFYMKVLGMDYDKAKKKVETQQQ